MNELQHAKKEIISQKIRDISQPQYQPSELKSSVHSAKNKIIGQSIITDPMKKLGFEPPTLGICAGYLGTYIQFTFDGRRHEFLKILNFLNEGSESFESFQLFYSRYLQH